MKGREIGRTERTLLAAKRKFGVEIVYNPVPEFFEQYGEGMFKENATPSIEEAQITINAIARTPGARALAQVIFFQRQETFYPLHRQVADGAYLGYERLSSFPRDEEKPADKAAIMIQVPSLEVGMLFKLSPEIALPNIESPIPLKTQEDYLDLVVTHMFGMAFLDQVRLAGSPNFEEYKRRRDDSAEYTRHSFDDNRVLASFAQLTGWKRMEYIDYWGKLADSGDEGVEELRQHLLKTNHKDNHRKMWVRDEAIWDSLTKPKAKIIYHLNF